MIYSPASYPGYDFLLSDKYNQSYIKNVLTLPSFVMAVNGVETLKLNKGHPSIIKKVLHMA